MKVVVIPIVIGILGTVTKGLVNVLAPERVTNENADTYIR